MGDEYPGLDALRRMTDFDQQYAARTSDPHAAAVIDRLAQRCHRLLDEIERLRAAQKEGKS